MKHLRWLVPASIVCAISLVVSGCGGSTDSSSASAPDLKIGSVDLSGVCPSTIVIQTTFNPQSEIGWAFNLLGSDYKIDTSKKSVSGPLMSHGEYTGVNVELRNGGVSVGGQTVPQVMYTDESVTLGFVDTSVALLAQNEPTTAVFAPFLKNGTVIGWDPATYPSVSTIAELSDALKANGGKILYKPPATYIAMLVQKGIVDKNALDPSYDGTPANFVAAGGKDAQQGSATAEPYLYEHNVNAWKKPIKYQLVSDLGWNPVTQPLVVRTGDLQKLTPCLQKFVPVAQKSLADYLTNPGQANDLVVKAAKEYNVGWSYGADIAGWAAKMLVSAGLMGNPPSGGIGTIDLGQEQQFINLATPIFKATGAKVNEALSAEAISTNKFIDPSVRLP